MSAQLTHGELFAGYGGLSLSVEDALGAPLAWYAEFSEAPSKIMARHWPDLTNYGDVTTIKWVPDCVECDTPLAVVREFYGPSYLCPQCHARMDVADRPHGVPYPVEVLSGGSPCQDVSAAGRRAGMNEGTRSNLWVAMREAIAAIRPTFVVWENVRGAHSASAHSKVESEPGLLGGGERAYLRATGRVVGDLASLGYDSQWRTVTASSVGAPHKRTRVFVFAWLRGAAVADGDGGRNGWRDVAPGEGGGEGADAPAVVSAGPHGGTGPAQTVGPLLPTVRASDGVKGGPNQRGSKGDLTVASAVHLMGTPRASKGMVHDIRNPEAVGNARARLEDQVALLPTPKAGDGEFGLPRTSGRPPERSTHLATRLAYTEFGIYAPAIARWAEATGNPAPPPTELTPRGKHRLSPWFTEWMMGLPPGWICDTPGITRNEQVTAAGNGVVRQQAAAALQEMYTHTMELLREQVTE